MFDCRNDCYHGSGCESINLNRRPLRGGLLNSDQLRAFVTSYEINQFPNNSDGALGATLSFWGERRHRLVKKRTLALSIRRSTARFRFRLPSRQCRPRRAPRRRSGTRPAPGGCGSSRARPPPTPRPHRRPSSASQWPTSPATATRRPSSCPQRRGRAPG